MENSADEREDERVLLERYHAQQPQPPESLDAQIRDAARQALATSPTPGSGDGPGETANTGRDTRAPRWFALAAAVTMVAMVLPGLLRTPQAPVSEGVASQADVESALARPNDAAIGRMEEAASVPSSARTLDLDAGDALAFSSPKAATAPAAQPAGKVRALARKGGEPRGPVPVVREEVPPAVSSLQQLADTLSIEVPPRGGGPGASGSDAVAELVPQHRLLGRFRPSVTQEEQVSVTLLDTMVVIVGEWSGQGEPCEPLLALDRAPDEPARVSVARIAGSGAEDFVFLRLESPSRVRLVHCTAEGWMVSAR